MKPKILCVCAEGLNRSKFLAKYLSQKGYETKFSGIQGNSPNPTNTFQIQWADIIISMNLFLTSLLKQKFSLENKKLITLNIPTINEISNIEKEILPHLPLEK